MSTSDGYVPKVGDVVSTTVGWGRNEQFSVVELLENGMARLARKIDGAETFHFANGLRPFPVFAAEYEVPQGALMQREQEPVDANCPAGDAPTPQKGVKHDQGKPRWDLLPFGALASVVDVLSYGAEKYSPDNWRHVDGARWRYFRALMGHATAWWRGEERDPESGLPHLAHAACCVLFLLELFGEDHPPEK